MPSVLLRSPPGSAAFRATAAYRKCKQQQDDALTRKERANSYVKLTAVNWSDPTGHIPSMYRELTGLTSAASRSTTRSTTGTRFGGAGS